MPSCGCSCSEPLRQSSYSMLLVVSGVARSTWLSTVGVAPEQPVPFSHKHHVG